ncbi:uncharacterized protein LOC125369289 [Ricinus communis]|uniref:uncharacterized protein LOC125369289 n=1 Tax=Ricinus communis TaxID=3988 RepID=UPI00201B1219|nr:uncharacterized protein LOC125369289 [Ricinus communis]
MVDNAAGGAMLERTPDEVDNIFKMLGANSQQKSVRTKRVEVNEVVASSEMTIQLVELIKGNMYDQTNLMNSYQPMHPMNDPYSNTYNTGTLENDGLVQSNEESIHKEEKVEPNLRLKEKEKEAFYEPEFYKAAQPYRPPIPFLNQPKESKKDEFFFERISQFMQKKFEELNTNRRRYANNKKVQIASVMLQHQLPLKMKDPGSFTINITTGDKKHTKAMLDLGASINLIPYLMYERLGLGELKPTTMSLQFADRSIKYPRGIVKDLLVQVGKLIIHVDFVVLDMENTPIRDKEQTILIGRPFMVTTRTVIDVHDEKFTMTVLGETVEFKMFDSLTLSPKFTIDKCSYNYLDSLIYEQLYDAILFLIDKSFRDTLDVRIKSIKPYLKGIAYDEEVECADERPP